MPSSVALDRLVRTNPPVFEGNYEGTAIEVRLDSSAVLKLEGKTDYERRAEILFPPPPQVENAVRRLIEARQVQPNARGIIVTVSALDLD